ncbi:hypothetical protein [uncultured Parasutterella sp.]|uniref:dienelactone hydrolase family protein n=1 Tax=uncultured Parasutterella sp. TaxID=1263098 RepID=UPI0025B6A96A|nr:hypothetical protein [uncultured Parasutterella sp.]
MTIEYTGSLQGSVRKHTEATLRETFVNAYVVLPEAGGAPKVGLLNEFANETASHPTVVFMHGSSGVNAQIKTFAYWLADALRVAVVIPDSMQTKDRLIYSSPVPAADYEDVHGMRLAELNYAMRELKNVPWCDGRVIIVGTSEGGVTAARYKPEEGMIAEKGRMIFSWSCEDNYHVASHNSYLPDTLPVLNVMSATDKFFSQVNSYLDNPSALGHAGKVLASNPNAQIVLLPGAPHTLFNLPAARDAAAAFLTRVLRS